MMNKDNETLIPDRQHLHRLPMIHNSLPPLFFITICSYKRKKILACEPHAGIIAKELKNSEKLHGWRVGRYVIMPDHVHFFGAPVEGAKSLSGYLNAFKSWTAKQAGANGAELPLWQKETFDHLLRSVESYAEKWEYVRRNPVRAGLCANEEDWPFQGEISIFPLHR